MALEAFGVAWMSSESSLGVICVGAGAQVEEEGMSSVLADAMVGILRGFESVRSSRHSAGHECRFSIWSQHHAALTWIQQNSSAASFSKDKQ
jgi:hypothetical protein